MSLVHLNHTQPVDRYSEQRFVVFFYTCLAKFIATSSSTMQQSSPLQISARAQDIHKV